MSLLRWIRGSIGWKLCTAASALAVSAVALLGNAAPAGASTTQLSIFEVPGIQGSSLASPDPAQTLQTLRSIGANMLRVEVTWSDIAPNPGSRTRPAFNAADPNSYPAGSWAPLDRLVSEAQADGIQLEFMTTGPAPLWATQSGGPPCGPTGGDGPVFCYDNAYEPSASEYGQFVQAVGSRYPSVHFWELWDEANWGPMLAPQYLNSSVPVSAFYYRGLLDAGWNALQATGHGGDTIVDSSLSQDGSANVGETGTSAPLTFIRTLWCADSSFNHLSGGAASAAGCPTTAAGYQQFKAAHPALFQGSGVGVHPYPYQGPPTYVQFPSPDGLEFGELPQLITTLDRLQQLYTPSGAYKLMGAYNDEYGYQTGYDSATNEAAYINQAEYLSYKNPRILSYANYELQDVGWFHTGLLNQDGSFKPSFYSYRLPVWLPVTSNPSGSAVEVWGNARPAYFARQDTGQPQNVLIQWAPDSSGQFQTITSVQASALGFFDTQVKFPGPGQVRLAWQYPAGDTRLRDPLDSSSWIYSRVTNISFFDPKLTHVSQSHARWRRSSRRTTIAAASVPPVGTTFRFTLPAQAAVQFAFTQNASGRKVGRRCVAQTSKNAGRRACTRSITAGAFSFTAGAGAHHVGFRGWVSKHKELKPGRYTLVITATYGGGQKATARLRFTIVS